MLTVLIVIHLMEPLLERLMKFDALAKSLVR